MYDDAAAQLQDALESLPGTTPIDNGHMVREWAVCYAFAVRDYATTTTGWMDAFR